jgi:anti-sigma factor RsiW
MEPNRNPLDLEAGLALSRWLDGAMPPAEAEAFARRMEASPALRREAEAMAELERLLERRPSFGDAPDVRGAVLARIDRDLQEDVGWRFLPRAWRMPVWAASWAACGILLAVALLGVLEAQPSAGAGETAEAAEDYLVASVDPDLSFVQMIDEVLETPGRPVDSMAGWLADPAGDSAEVTAP